MSVEQSGSSFKIANMSSPDLIPGMVELELNGVPLANMMGQARAHGNRSNSGNPLGDTGDRIFKPFSGARYRLSKLDEDGPCEPIPYAPLPDHDPAARSSAAPWMEQAAVTWLEQRATILIEDDGDDGDNEPANEVVRTQLEQSIVDVTDNYESIQDKLRQAMQIVPSHKYLMPFHDDLKSMMTRLTRNFTTWLEMPHASIDDDIVAIETVWCDTFWEEAKGLSDVIARVCKDPTDKIDEPTDEDLADKDDNDGNKETTKTRKAAPKRKQRDEREQPATKRKQQGDCKQAKLDAKKATKKTQPDDRDGDALDTPAPTQKKPKENKAVIKQTSKKKKAATKQTPKDKKAAIKPEQKKAAIKPPEKKAAMKRWKRILMPK